MGLSLRRLPARGCFELHPLYHPCSFFLPADNAQVDENKLKGRSLQEPRSLQLVSVVAVRVLVRDAAAGFVAAVEVVDAVVADVAAEKDGVEKIKLVLYF